MAFSLIRSDTGRPVGSGGIVSTAAKIALYPMTSGTVRASIEYFWHNTGDETSLAALLPKNPYMVLTGARVQYGTTEVTGVVSELSRATALYEAAKREGKSAALATSAASGVIKLDFGCVPSDTTVNMKLFAVFTPRISNKELCLLIPTSSSPEFCMSGTTGGPISLVDDPFEWKPLVSVDVMGSFPRVKSGRIDFGEKQKPLIITEGEDGVSRVASRGSISHDAGPAIQLKLELVEHVARPLGGYVIRPDALVVWAGGLPSSIPAPSTDAIFTLLTIFVDCSGSMSTTVGTDEHGKVIDRLTMAKTAAVGVLKDVVAMKKEGVWVEVIAFGTTAFFVTPTTGDHRRLAVCTTNESDMARLMEQIARMWFDGGTELNIALGLAQLGAGDDVVIGRGREKAGGRGREEAGGRGREEAGGREVEIKRHVDVQEWIVITDGCITGKVLPHGPLVRCSSFGIGDADEASLLAISQAPGRTTNLSARPSGGGSSATYDVDALEASISLALGDSLNTVPCPRLKLEGVDASTVFALKDMPPVGRRDTVMVPLVVPLDDGMKAGEKAEYVQRLLGSLQLVQGEVVMPLKLTRVEDGVAEAALCAVAAAAVLRDPAPSMTVAQKTKLALDCGVAVEGLTAFVMVDESGASIAKNDPVKHTVGIMRAPTVMSLDDEAPTVMSLDAAARQPFAFAERRVTRGMGGGGGGGGSGGGGVAVPLVPCTTRGGGIFDFRTTRGGGGVAVPLVPRGGGGSGGFYLDTTTRGVAVPLVPRGDEVRINIPATPPGRVPDSMPDADLRRDIKILLKTLNASFTSKGYWAHSEKLMRLCATLGISYAVVNNVVCVDGVMAFFWGAARHSTAEEMRDELVLPEVLRG